MSGQFSQRHAGTSRPATAPAEIYIAGCQGGQAVQESACYQALCAEGHRTDLPAGQTIADMLAPHSACFSGMLITPYTGAEAHPGTPLSPQLFAQAYLFPRQPIGDNALPVQRVRRALDQWLKAHNIPGEIALSVHRSPNLPRHLTNPQGRGLLSDEEMQAAQSFIQRHHAPQSAQQGLGGRGGTR